jgi:hypothetical protein
MSEAIARVLEKSAVADAVSRYLPGVEDSKRIPTFRGVVYSRDISSSPRAPHWNKPTVVKLSDRICFTKPDLDNVL